MIVLEDWSVVPCSLCGHVENQCWLFWDAVCLAAACALLEDVSAPL